MTIGEIYRSSLISYDVGLNKEQENSVLLLSLSLFLSEVRIIKDGFEVNTESLSIEELSNIDLPNSYIRDFMMCSELYITKISNNNLGIVKNFGINQDEIISSLEEETIRNILKKRHNCKESFMILTN